MVIFTEDLLLELSPSSSVGPNGIQTLIYKEVYAALRVTYILPS